MKFVTACILFSSFWSRFSWAPFFSFLLFFFYLKIFLVQINFLSFLVSFFLYFSLSLFLFTYSFSVVLSFFPSFLSFCLSVCLSVCMSVFPSFLFRLSFAVFKSSLRSLSRMHLLGFQRIHLLILSIYRHYNSQKYPDQ